MAESERTKDGALETLLQIRAEKVERLSETTQSILTDSLLRDVFAIAWHYQFEEDRRQARKEVGNLVQDAVLATVLGGEE